MANTTTWASAPSPSCLIGRSSQGCCEPVREGCHLCVVEQIAQVGCGPGDRTRRGFTTAIVLSIRTCVYYVDVGTYALCSGTAKSSLPRRPRCRLPGRKQPWAATIDPVARGHVTPRTLGAPEPPVAFDFSTHARSLNELASTQRRNRSRRGLLNSAGQTRRLGFNRAHGTTFRTMLAHPARGRTGYSHWSLRDRDSLHLVVIKTRPGSPPAVRYFFVH